MKSFKRDEILHTFMGEGIGELENRIFLSDVVPCRLVTGRSLYEMGYLTKENAFELAERVNRFRSSEDSLREDLQFTITKSEMQILAEMDLFYDEISKNGDEIDPKKLFVGLASYNSRLLTPIDIDVPSLEYQAVLKANLKYFFPDTKITQGVSPSSDIYWPLIEIGNKVINQTPTSRSVSEELVEKVKAELGDARVSDQIKMLGEDNSKFLVEAILAAHEKRRDLYGRSGVVHRIILGYSANSESNNSMIVGVGVRKGDYLVRLDAFLDNPHFK